MVGDDRCKIQRINILAASDGVLKNKLAAGTVKVELGCLVEHIVYEACYIYIKKWPTATR